MKRKVSIPASADGLRLAAIVEAPEKPKAVVQFVHGMCEHKERYVPFMEYLASMGYACVIHDNRGHGESVKSMDDLGYMYDGGWRALVEDVRLVNEWIREEYPGLRCFLFGHSMGSMIVRSFVKRYDDMVDGLFVCGSPSYNPASAIARWVCGLMMWCGAGHCRPALIQKLAFDGFNKPFAKDGYPSAWVCSDKDVLEAYHSDPYCSFIFTANGFHNLFALMQDCYSKKGWGCRNAAMGVHFLSGGNDPCRISDRHFLKAVERMDRYYNTDYRLFSGMRHEVLNETDKYLVWEYVAGLIDRAL